MGFKRRFSFSGMIQNAFPAILDSADVDVDVLPQEADLLFIHQIARPQPQYLVAEAFAYANVVKNNYFSRSVHATLLKHSIIGSADVPGSEAVDTRKIDKNFTKKMSQLSIYAQKRLVGLLFFWEEEVTRFRLLDEEEKEILKIMEECDAVGEERGVDLSLALERVDVKRRMRPTMRGYRQGGKPTEIQHQLPSYG